MEVYIRKATSLYGKYREISPWSDGNATGNGNETGTAQDVIATNMGGYNGQPLWVGGIECTFTNTYWNNDYLIYAPASALDCQADGFAVVEPGPASYEVIHGNIESGVTVTPADSFVFEEDDDVTITVEGDPATRYTLLVNDVEEIPEFMGFASITLEAPNTDLEIDVELSAEVPVVEEPTWAEGGRLVLWGMTGGSESANFSIPDWENAGVYVIPPTGSIGVTPANVGGFWKELGIRSDDGRALPPGTWAIQVFTSEVWVDVCGFVIGENQQSSGVMPCMILKSGMREFRIRFITEGHQGQPPVPPDPASPAPDDGGVVEQDETGTDPEFTPEGEPVPTPGKAEPPTWPEPPEIPPAETEDCVCSPYYVAIAEELEWGFTLMNMELEFIGDQIGWVGDILDDRLFDINSNLERIAEALERIAEKPPVEVSVESGYNHSVQYPVAGVSGQEIDQYLDGRF